MKIETWGVERTLSVMNGGGLDLLVRLRDVVQRVGRRRAHRQVVHDGAAHGPARGIDHITECTRHAANAMHASTRTVQNINAAITLITGIKR